MPTGSDTSLPIINIGPLLGFIDVDGNTIQVDSNDERLKQSVSKVVDEIEYACKNVGFFYISGHGVPPSLIESLLQSSHAFFQQPLEVRERIDMNAVGGMLV